MVSSLVACLDSRQFVQQQPSQLIKSRLGADAERALLS